MLYMNGSQQLVHILDEHHLSLTKPRLAVFHTLQQADTPLRISDIIKRCPNIHRASIYRTIDVFTSLHIITVTIRGWVPYISLAEHFKPHHHHISCTHCGCKQPIDSPDLEETLRTASRTQGFHLQNHTIELTGVCATCQKATADATIGAPVLHLRPHDDAPQSHCCPPLAQ